MDIIFSREQFSGYTHRFKVQLKTAELNYDLTIYSNSDSYQKLDDFIKEKKSDKVLSFDIYYRTSKEQDEKTAEFIDKNLTQL